jgi:hypothetical protein
MSRHPHIVRFLRIHGRVPEIKDPAPPWRPLFNPQPARRKARLLI